MISFSLGFDDADPELLLDFELLLFLEAEDPVDLLSDFLLD